MSNSHCPIIIHLYNRARNPGRGVIMVEDKRVKNLAGMRSKSHMPANSIFFEKIVPVLLAVLGVIMVGLIMVAAGVLLGLIKF
jgi:hypothetical protein